jgi:hypothetical protein
METLMHSFRKIPVTIVLLVTVLIIPTLFLSGCMMTPEDKAFYGRGWINPDELDQDQSPPHSDDPTAIPPHMMGPGEY